MNVKSRLAMIREASLKTRDGSTYRLGILSTEPRHPIEFGLEFEQPV